MTTARETALAALESLLVATFGALDENGKVVRDPEKSPEEKEDGLIIMRDGEPGQPDITLSPVRYQWAHQAFLEFSTTGESRGKTLDDLLLQFDAALAADRQLSGAVIDARVMGAPIIDEVDTAGATTVRAATVLVDLFYVSDSPIG